MMYVLRPVIFFGMLATWFVYGNSLDAKALNNWSSNFLLACVLVFVVGWYFAPARAVWLGLAMRSQTDAEKATKRRQMIGWITAWMIINITLLVARKCKMGSGSSFFATELAPDCCAQLSIVAQWLSPC